MSDTTLIMPPRKRVPAAQDARKARLEASRGNSTAAELEAHLPSATHLRRSKQGLFRT